MDAINVVERPALGLRLCLGCGAHIQDGEWSEHRTWHRRVQQRLSSLSQVIEQFKNEVDKLYLETQIPC